MNNGTAQLALEVLTATLQEPEDEIKATRFYSTKEVAHFLSCSPSHVCSLVKRGRLISVRFAGESGMIAPRLKFTSESIKKYLG